MAPSRRTRTTPARRAAGILALSAPIAWLGGCASTIPAECDRRPAAARADFGAHDPLPRSRLGCLPFPGLFTLFKAADPDDLGAHSYAGSGGETDRGIVYTTRGGFLDIAHIRNSVDTTAYIHARVAHAMRAGWDCVRFRLHEPSVYTVTLEYPASWDELSTGERWRAREEAAVALSQRLALEAMTWHEILTWYGYKSTVVISEAGSAFTYEDGPSHAVGVLIAGEAIRRGGDFDAEVTALLDQTLAELGVVGGEELEAAIAAVDGDWWSGGSTKRRHLETGLERGAITPWVVDEVPFADPGGPVTWFVPTLENVMGHDCTALATVAIDPNVFESGKIRSRLRPGVGDVDPGRDFPLLMADIRRSIGAEFARIERGEHSIEAASRAP
jgi:hypothetical protein